MHACEPGCALLQVRLFGQAEVLVNGEPIGRLHTRRGFWLMALLALRAGAPIERSRLAGNLWPDSDEPAALHNLRQVLKDLRHALGPAAARLQTGEGRTVRLEVCREEVDALGFDRSIAKGTPEALEEAVQLYRGPLFEGCDQPWILPERAAREEAFLQALETLAKEATATGDNAGAARWLRRAVAADPYREPACRALMQALVESGQTAAATEVYRELRQRLYRDLHAEPDAATTALYRALRDGGVPTPPRAIVHASPGPQASPPRPSCRLQAPRRKLLGREEEMRELSALVLRSRLVTLTGTGGIGKTSLALAVGHVIQDEFADGAAFAGLAPLSQAESVPEAVLMAVGADTNSGRDALGTLLDHLHERQMLLVIDNCEHLLGASADLVDRILSSGTGVSILATSRHPLGLLDEVVWRVPSLAVPPRPPGPDDEEPVEAPPIPCASVELFLRRAQAAQRDFHVSAGSSDSVDEICRMMDGIPLAIELAAARVRALSPDQICERLRTGLGLLASAGPALHPRHQTLDTAFEWSWHLLGEGARVVLRRLAVFAGGFTLAAAESVCSTGYPTEDLPVDSIADQLTELVDSSFLIFQSAAPAPAEGEPVREARYQILEPVRQFAAARMRKASEADLARARHRDYYLCWAEEVRPNLWLADQAIWFDRLEADHDNLRAALELCRWEPEGSIKELRLIVALARFWDTHGHLREGRSHVERAIARMTPDAPAAIRAATLVHAGWMAGVQEDNEAACQHYRRALLLFDQEGDLRNRANTLGYLATVLRSMGEFEQARILLEESLSIRRELGIVRLGSVLNNLGELEFKLGDLGAARGHLEESISTSAQPGMTTQQLGSSLCSLSHVDLAEGRVEDAFSHASNGLRTLYEGGAMVRIPQALELMTEIAAAQGDLGRAARLLGAATGLSDSLGLPRAQPEEEAARLGFDLQSHSFRAAFSEGLSWTLDEAVENALSG